MRKQLFVCILLLAIFLVPRTGNLQAQSPPPPEWEIAPSQRLIEASLRESSVSLSNVTSGGGPIGSAFRIDSDRDNSQELPAVAYNTDRAEYLVVWSERATGEYYKIRAQRLSKDGTRLSSFLISAQNDVDYFSPDVAYNSVHQQYFVIYDYHDSDASEQGIRAKTIAGDGGTGGTEFTIVHGAAGDPEPYHSPAVAYASTADRYLIAFVYFSAYDNVLVTAYDHEGTRYGEFVSLAGTSLYPIEKPELAYNSARNEFLVVWQQQAYVDGSSQSKDIYGRRVEMSGGVNALDAPFAISDDTTDEEKNPTVAALPNAGADGQYLVVFEYDNLIDNHLLRGRAIGGTGALDYLITFPYHVSSDAQKYPAVAASESASRYLVAWYQQRHDTTALDSEIVGRAVAADGTLLGGLLQGSQSLGGGYRVYGSSIAAGPVGDFLVVFENVLEESGNNWRIYGRFWGNRIYLPLVLRG